MFRSISKVCCAIKKKKKIEKIIAIRKNYKYTTVRSISVTKPINVHYRLIVLNTKKRTFSRANRINIVSALGNFRVSIMVSAHVIATEWAGSRISRNIKLNHVRSVVNRVDPIRLNIPLRMWKTTRKIPFPMDCVRCWTRAVAERDFRVKRTMCF